MTPAAQTIRAYSPEELHLLAMEGRLKGRGVQSLVRRPFAPQARPDALKTFENHLKHQSCWTDSHALLHTFLDLIHIHSPSRREDHVAAYLIDRLKTLQFPDITQDAIGNIIAATPGTSPNAPSLLFTAHMDCVYPGHDAPVQPVFYASGEIRTTGTNSLGADDKTGITAILATLEYIHNAQLPHGEIRVVFTVQEELGYRGIKHVPANILNGIHLVISMDPPVRVERNETSAMAVLHMPSAHPFVHLVRQSAHDCGFDPLILFAEDGYVGGDTLCLSPLGALIADFCSTSRYAHTQHEHIRMGDLIQQTNWMMATVERTLSLDPSQLDLHAVYGDQPIGTLIGVRKQIPLTETRLKEKRDLANTLHTRSGPQQVPALVHLSAIAPRIGDPDLLCDVVNAYTQCLKMDQVPQVLRDLSLAMFHLATNLADVRPLEPLIDVAKGVIDQSGEDIARIHALHFLIELFQKSRRIATKNRLLRLFILCLQSSSARVVEATHQFLRANLNEIIHPLTVAFCNRDRATWERQHKHLTGRIIERKSRTRNTEIRWTTIRQNILQLLLEEDRILPEMLEWIFTHDSAATQKIAVGFIDPSKTTHIANRILHNLKIRQSGVQETAVHFVGKHRMTQAIDPLIDLILTPYLCRNKSLVEWALNTIGAPALNEVVRRLGSDAEHAPFVRQMFNTHDRSTDADFAQLTQNLQTTYGQTIDLADPAQLNMLGYYLGSAQLTNLHTLSRWDKRRAIIFYDHLIKLYPEFRELERLSEYLEEIDGQTRSQFARMAMQKNIFKDPEFLALVCHENARFLEQLALLEKQIPLNAILSRLRELTSGSQLDMADPRDVEIYYLYLLKQSPQMPDRMRYLKHIQEARNRSFPTIKPYCKAFAITGDRIEEVGTVDREHIRLLIDQLPHPENRAQRLRRLLTSNHIAKRERQRIINSLSDVFNTDINPYNTLEDRLQAVTQTIDFEFDAAYRPVLQIIFPHLMRVRMKHRSETVIAPLADYALEYAMMNHPEIQEAFDTGETDLLLDNLNDLFTDRVYEAERELSEEVFQELKDKHLKALSQFYTGNWTNIIRDLKKRFPEGRQAKLIDATAQAMTGYDIFDEEESALLDTNLNRLLQVLHIEGTDLMDFHNRHRECFKVYTALLHTRNLRQIKRIYREVYLILQDELSFANREYISPKEILPKYLSTGHSEEVAKPRIPAKPGYLKYARKELGKLGKLMADFVLEQALSEHVSSVQSEIAKLRQVVIGTSQIMCAPSKDVSIIYRSWPGNDCNTGDMAQILCPDCSFYKIISDAQWKGYFTLVELRRQNQRALLLDVLNFSGLKMENENFIKVLMHQIIQMAQNEGIHYVLTSPQETHISNRDYIRRAFKKSFPSLGSVQHFAILNTPTARFQSLNPNLSIAWQSPEIEN